MSTTATSAPSFTTKTLTLLTSGTTAGASTSEAASPSTATRQPHHAPGDPSATGQADPTHAAAHLPVTPYDGDPQGSAILSSSTDLFYHYRSVLHDVLQTSLQLPRMAPDVMRRHVARHLFERPMVRFANAVLTPLLPATK